MAKYFILLIAVLPVALSGQDIYLGGKAGLNYAGISGENGITYDKVLKYHAGATAEFSFSETLSVQPEILFSTAGAKSGNSEIDLSYLSIPLLIKYYAVEELFSIDIGGQFSYLMDYKVILDGEHVENNLSYESNEIALVFGATVKTYHKVFFQTRYLLGISEIDTAGKNRNGIFQISVGYQFK